LAENGIGSLKRFLLKNGNFHGRDFVNSNDDVNYRLELSKGFLNEASYRLPWDIFDKESAEVALKSARRCYKAASDIVNNTRRWRSKNK